ncbi:MAG: hypothetical protein P4K93_03435 [Terracidiphilus sp.]|nr:hypothetical protein [Terracidiphilus sp.]MDR3797176.1 hypothetical protein [Terracidiphilus sp.]
MRPRIIGRALGVGVRVAGRMAGQLLEGRPQSAAAAPQFHQAVPVARSQAQSSNHQNRAAGKAAAHATVQAAQSMGQASHSVSRGVGGFLRPFRRVGGILWLEVTGVFFLLPVFVFAPSLWREIQAYTHNGDHRTLWVTAGVVAVFLYLGVSSFWRAHRRSKRS